MPPAATPRPPSTRRRWLRVTGTLLVAMGVAGAALVAVAYRNVTALRSAGLTFASDVYVHRAGGDTVRASAGDGIYYQACIRPDGGAVVYYGGREGPPRLWVTELSTSATRALTPPDHAALHPSDPSDGAWVVFASDRACGPPPGQLADLMRGGLLRNPRALNLYVIPAAGGAARAVTRGAFLDQRPAFSPDGKKIAFVSSRGGPGQIWEVASDGQAPPVQIQKNGLGNRPWYGPDGATIYFHTQAEDRHALCRVPSGGGAIELLANDDFDSAHGTFVDPGGEVLLVHAKRGGPFEPWQVPLDGSAPRRLALPGFPNAIHLTRARDGSVAFDLPRAPSIRDELRRWLRQLWR